MLRGPIAKRLLAFEFRTTCAGAAETGLASVEDTVARGEEVVQGGRGTPRVVAGDAGMGWEEWRAGKSWI